MNLLHLRYAVEIDKCGSINKAAQKLFVSQPHLSHCLKELEESLGISIFKRTKQGVIVTADGRELLKYADSILLNIEAFEEKYKKKKIGVDIKIAGVKSSIFTEAFSCLMKEYEEKTHVRATYIETGLLETIEYVKKEKVDVGMIVYYSNDQTKNFWEHIVESNNMLFVPIHHLRPHIIISKNDGAVCGDSIETSKLAGYTYVTYDTFEHTTLDMENEHRMVNLPSPNKVVFVTDRCIVLTLLANEKTYAISHKLQERTADRFNLISVLPKNNSPQVMIGYIQLKNRQLSAVTESYLEHVKRISFSSV